MNQAQSKLKSISNSLNKKKKPNLNNYFANLTHFRLSLAKLTCQINLNIKLARQLQDINKWPIFSYHKHKQAI